MARMDAGTGCCRQRRRHQQAAPVRASYRNLRNPHQSVLVDGLQLSRLADAGHPPASPDTPERPAHIAKRSSIRNTRKRSAPCALDDGGSHRNRRTSIPHLPHLEALAGGLVMHGPHPAPVLLPPGAGQPFPRCVGFHLAHSRRLQMVCRGLPPHRPIPATETIRLTGQPLKDEAQNRTPGLLTQRPAFGQSTAQWIRARSSGDPAGRVHDGCRSRSG